MWSGGWDSRGAAKVADRVGCGVVKGEEGDGDHEGGGMVEVEACLGTVCEGSNWNGIGGKERGVKTFR